MEEQWNSSLVKEIKYQTDDYKKGKDKLLEALLHSDIDSQASDYDQDFLKKTRKMRASQTFTSKSNNDTNSSNVKEKKAGAGSKFPCMPESKFKAPLELVDNCKKVSSCSEVPIKNKPTIVSNIAFNSVPLRNFKLEKKTKLY
ncbi:uncharacterized protein LOC122506379 isoform X2 [Leptopilina heterotoma]|uniref:uncharacterized protein LOC122506379 isoform X2 n=1 Tax=Leptopilina heterotoma TaxID=63436 RepID=UPI001CAA3B23|nr:uncharacterized protein LOC122506379 isoform X2 [Leptopilina heterotoma]